MSALLLDWWLGEVRRFHPLIVFGRSATWVESCLYLRLSRWRGFLALLIVVLPLTIMVSWIATQATGLWEQAFSVLILYFAIGHKSLHQHALPVAHALNEGDEALAREQVARIVSRDPATLNIAAAATESVLENGSDSVFAALFWFAIAGPTGVVMYRLTNTLDAMWGYRNDQYRCFGWAAARFDDVLNWLPARLTALSYALLGNTGLGLRCWRTQAALWDSPNAGPVMAAGAGALAIRIGGPAQYHGEWHDRPYLGPDNGPSATAVDIERALRLVRWCCVFWVVVLFAIEWGIQTKLWAVL